ncbi:sigma-54-dependent Fis family transcriptional regulator [Pseudonocardia sp. RS010]|uniref:sigma-54-dependent Fis family transcriptional regulator n=1 Tax=Pseudonocardia sp. RS010 TaxID=3385979 RepID=UPI0039A0EBE3
MYRGEQSEFLRGERERLLDDRSPLDTVSAFRAEIMSSWQRCRLVGVRPTGEEVPYQPEFERPNRLLRAAGPVIDRLAEQLEDGPVSILLADSDAQIIDRRAGQRTLAQALDKALVSPGFLYAEEFTGTNGIGTALEAATPFMVSGAEHFRENLQEFTCIGSPVKHPITGKVEGVLDVTCRVGDTHGVIKPLVLAAVREIESRMYADASRREQMLLEQFLRANRRATSAVISLNEDVVMANTAASALLDLSDQAVLWGWACRMLGTCDEYTGEVRLAGDVVAQAKATRVGEKGAPAGVLVEMRAHTRSDGRAPAARRGAGRPRAPRALDSLPGRSVATRRLHDDVEAALRTERPVLLCGEAGTGKLHVARHIHRRRAGQDPLTVLDAVLACDDSNGWLARLRNVLADGGAVVLRHVDRLEDGLVERMEAIIDAAPPGSVTATARARGGRTPADRLLDHFPFSLTVPPLRYRTDDIVDLAPMLLAEHTTQRPVPRLLSGTVRTLAGLDWPGNIRELDSVLATAVARSMGSDIAQEHLPPEYRSMAPRSGGSSLQRAERDIVLEALVETRGNKLAAAERLGIARSTLYRKMRMLGIDEKHLPTTVPAR